MPEGLIFFTYTVNSIVKSAVKKVVCRKIDPHEQTNKRAHGPILVIVWRLCFTEPHARIAGGRWSCDYAI